MAAVIGGAKIHDLGFAYILEPILLNTITIFLVAIVFNSFFKWRQYPAYLPYRKKDVALKKPKGYETTINHEDFVYALTQIDTFVDVTEEDLLKIYKLATGRHIDKNITTHQEHS